MQPLGPPEKDGTFLFTAQRDDGVDLGGRDLGDTLCVLPRNIDADLGSGAGIDLLLAAKKVGQTGKVTSVKVAARKPRS